MKKYAHNFNDLYVSIKNALKLIRKLNKQNKVGV